MNYIRMSLEETERLFPFPYPLKTIGYYPGEINNPDLPPMREHQYFFRNEYQLSLRLTSPAENIRNNIDGVEYLNTFPHVIMKCPGHKYFNDYPFAKPNSLCIHYNCKDFQPFFDAHFASGPLAWDVKMTPQIISIIHEITEKLHISQSYSIADKLDILAFQLLEELLLFRINTGEQQLRGNSRQRIQNIASYIQLNYNTNIDFDALLSANNISRSTFFRHWQTVYGNTPQVYQAHLRMKEAERLLLETGSTVQSIAKQLGYSSSAYFCAIFKKHKGCSPAEFSRKHLQKEKKNF